MMELLSSLFVGLFATGLTLGGIAAIQIVILAIIVVINLVFDLNMSVTLMMIILEAISLTVMMIVY